MECGQHESPSSVDTSRGPAHSLNLVDTLHCTVYYYGGHDFFLFKHIFLIFPNPKLPAKAPITNYNNNDKNRYDDVLLHCALVSVTSTRGQSPGAQSSLGSFLHSVLG